MIVAAVGRLRQPVPRFDGAGPDQVGAGVSSVRSSVSGAGVDVTSGVERRPAVGISRAASVAKTEAPASIQNTCV
jgi:hypothetical protein